MTMENKLETLIELLGQETAEQILSGYIKANIDRGLVRKELKPVTEIKTMKKSRRHVSHQAKAWDEEEETQMKVRALEVYREKRNWSSVAVMLAQESGRTPSSIFNRIYGHWRLNELPAAAKELSS